MPISDDQLNQILQQQQAQLDAQMRLLETLTQQLSIHSSSSHAISSTSCDAVASSIPEFIYDPESGNTFLTWFKRWEDTFRTEFCNQDDAWKTRLLVRKLESNEHARFADHILPNFEETVFQLSEIFGELSSLLSIRYRCLNLVKREADEYGVLADIVNRECERFKLRSLTDDQFKCLIFIKALQSPQDAEVRTRLLARLDQDPNVTLRTLTDECKRLQIQKPVTTRNKPRTACWLCGDWHYSKSLSLVAAFQTNYDIRRKYINGISARLQIDTASDITLVSRETYNLLGKPPMKPSKKTAKNASGGVLKLVGELQCEFFFNGTNCTGICYLTERPNLDLLGLDMLDRLGIMDVPINSVCNVSCSSLDTPVLPQKTGERLPGKLKRKIRTHFDVIRPTPAIEPQRNLSMENQFNRHHEAQRRLFMVGQKVLAMDYRGKHSTWTAGRILKKKGSVVYEVSVGLEVWVRHANQLNATSIAKSDIANSLRSKTHISSPPRFSMLDGIPYLHHNAYKSIYPLIIMIVLSCCSHTESDFTLVSLET
ncbi:unnamed protein product [Schistosoma margrebowiei]|uniref:DUF7083 domain-containing protein n=1 Tax=Schistosoma margrebowiei TaxID=48269 RepID=A0A183M1I8_9TREM|nr:unnamed protein product [Schistosoma margrebowiei]